MESVYRKRKCEKDREYCVYRYINSSTSQIYYVGKTNSSLRARVTAHRYEEKFQNINNYSVEYISLSNAIETDSVEKFLINKWKPILNTKDKVFGFSSILESEMNSLQWIPYEIYEKRLRNSKTVKNAVKRSNDLVSFFHATLLANGNYFTFPFLITEAIPIPGTNIYGISEQDVVSCREGYRYKVRHGVRDLIELHKEEIEAELWLPSLNLCKMTDDEELIYSILMQQIEFGDRISLFAKNGYEDENSLYRFNFRSEYPGGDIYLPYEMIFDGNPLIDTKSRTISGDINQFSFEEEMPLIKKNISKKIISFAYEMAERIVEPRSILRQAFEMEM